MSASFVIVRNASRACAIPLACVVETMRPLPVRAVSGAPPFVSGLSVVRGTPIPVIPLGALLGGRAESASRFVTLRVGARHVALAVEEVVGVRELEPSRFHELPPLLREAPAQVSEAIGTLDGELLVLLRAARLIPEDAWKLLEHQDAAS